MSINRGRLQTLFIPRQASGSAVKKNAKTFTRTFFLTCWLCRRGYQPNLMQSSNTRLLSRRNVLNSSITKIHYDGCRHIKFRKISISHDWMKTFASNLARSTSRPYGNDRMTKTRNRKLIRVTSSDERPEQKGVDLDNYNT